MTSFHPPGLSAWRFVLTFGTVSLLADFMYEGARSVTGPLLAALGASAILVGIVTGVGEAAALLLRLVSGPLADRTQRFWSFALAGYALTVIAVPALGYVGVLWVACCLVILERVGKAVRSPAKDALLSYATAATGRGRGFAAHEAIDQVGAVIGPLVVATMLALTGVQYGPALAVLAAPGVLAIALLVWLRMRVPLPVHYERGAATGRRGSSPSVPVAKLPRRFWMYSVFTATTMAGFGTFGVISFHLVIEGVIDAPVVPVLYAAVMIVDAAAALASGWAYDRLGPGILVALPIVAALVPVFAFSSAVWPAVIGALLWGVALGIQESTLRATIADLVDSRRRSTAYGLFAAVVGVATAAGGALAGALYQVSVPVLIAVTIAVQLGAVAVLFATGLAKRLRPRRPPARARGPIRPS